MWHSQVIISLVRTPCTTVWGKSLKLKIYYVTGIVILQADFFSCQFGITHSKLTPYIEIPPCAHHVIFITEF